MSSIRRVLLFWLILMPLVVWRQMYEGPKVVWFLVGGFCLCIYWLIKVIKGRYIIPFGKRDIFFLLWLSVLVISGAVSEDFSVSILGGSYRHQGAVFFFTLFLVMKLIESLNKKEKIFLIRGMSFVVLGEAVLVVWQYLTQNLYFGRPLGTFGEANAVAGFLALGVYFLLKVARGKALVLSLLLVAVYLTNSRTGVVMFFIMLGSFLPRIPKSFKKPLIFLVIILAFFGFVVFKRAQYSRRISDVENRTLFSQIAVEYIMQKPLLGWGAEAQEELYDQWFLARGLSLEGMIIDRSHNLFLDVGLWSGFVGLAFFFLWLIAVVSEAVKKKDVLKLLTYVSWFAFSSLLPLGVVHWLLLVIIAYL